MSITRRKSRGEAYAIPLFLREFNGASREIQATVLFACRGPIIGYLAIHRRRKYSGLPGSLFSAKIFRGIFGCVSVEHACPMLHSKRKRAAMRRADATRTRANSSRVASRKERTVSVAQKEVELVRGASSPIRSYCIRELVVRHSNAIGISIS